MKVFDLNKKTKYKKGELQNNIKDLKKTFGNKFFIKYKKFKIPVKFELKNLKYKGFKYLILKYDIEKQTDYLLPFKIRFLDKDYILNNNVFIENIHKTDNISGTEMVNFVLELLKKLGTNQALLQDGATIKCNNNIINLSFFKLIEKKRGFYEKFGFKLSSQMSNNLKNDFPNNSTMYNLLYNTIDNFKKIKLNYYKDIYTEILKIIFNVIKTQDYNKIEIGILDYIDFQNKNNITIVYLTDKEYELLHIFTICNNILKLIKNTKHKYLYKLMIESINENKCEIYNQIMHYIIHNNLYLIKYGNKIIKFENLDIFHTLEDIKNLSILYYDF